MTRILLIDADVVAYKAAASSEKAIEFEPGYWSWIADFEEAKQTFEDLVSNIMDTLGGTENRLCLTDSGNTFRHAILPSYKGNRAGVKKPLVLKAMRQWLIEERGAYLRPHLEGDDCMGILATWPKLKGEKVIVSIDKDMKTIPGLFCRKLEDGVVEVSEDDADYFHLFQTLTGDTTDGYAGCPGIGPKKAEAILSGVSRPWGTSREAWDAVVATFEKAGLNEAEALVQARCARILRATDYDFKNKKPILWSPPTGKQ